MIWAIVGVIGFLLPVMGLALLSLSAGRPSTLGITAGRLAACPDSPNCVSSLATNKDQHVESFPLSMRQNASDVAIHVEADYSHSLMRQLSDGLLDIGVMYNPRQTPGLVIEDLLEETLVLVATDQRKLTDGWIEDYVFVDWGAEFRRRHSEAFPDMDTPAVSVGLGSLGLEYIRQNGGSGYFPMRVVQPIIDRGELFVVGEAPTMQRPAYMVYPEVARFRETLDLALTGLREIARQWEPR